MRNTPVSANASSISSDPRCRDDSTCLQAVPNLTAKATMDLCPITSDDCPALAEILVSIGMISTADLSAATAFQKHLVSERVIGRKLVVDGVFVGGGQLTMQKFPHAVELGFWIRKDLHRHGYGSAVARLLTELALGPLQYHRVFAKTYSNNLGSRRCLEKAGMRLEGTLRDAGKKDGAYFDEWCFSRLQSDPSVLHTR